MLLQRGSPAVGGRAAAAAPHPPSPALRSCTLIKPGRQLTNRNLCQSSQHDQQQTQQQQQPQAPQQQAPVQITNTPSTLNSSSAGNGMYSIMTALAAAGALETAYLTATKLLNASVTCPTNGCDSVLNSAFGTLFGLPLPLYGAATYSAVAVAAGLAAAKVAADRPVPGWLNTGEAIVDVDSSQE